MQLSTRSRLAGLTIAATTALAAPLLASPAHAVAPVVPAGACLTEVSALTEAQGVWERARTAQAEAKGVKDAAVASYLANPTSETLAIRNTARTELADARAATVAAKSDRVAKRGVLDACIVRIPSVVNVRHAPPEFEDPDLLVGEITVNGLQPDSYYILGSEAACGAVERLCEFVATDANGTFRTSSIGYLGQDFPVARCASGDVTDNKFAVYDTNGALVTSALLPIPAGIC